MDIKGVELITRIHQKIVKQSFDEIDICSLLILIRSEAIINRDYMQIEWQKGFLHEICDFIAHRNRNRGFVFEEASLIYQRSTSTGVFHFDTPSKRMVFTGMFESIIIKEINEVFDKFGLEHIPEVCEVEIILCIISLLQCVKVESIDNKVQGTLYTILCEDGIYLFYDIFEAGISLPILQVEDKRYFNIVSNERVLKDTCFSLSREGKVLKIVLPE